MPRGTRALIGCAMLPSSSLPAAEVAVAPVVPALTFAGPGSAAAMNFSEVFKLSSLLCKFSPDGKYLASCVQYRLVIRDVNTLQILQLYTCLDQIQHIEWSADSLFILCAMYKRGLVQVWSLEQPEWHCRIDEGSAGLVASCWSPDGRHILNTTEFHVSARAHVADPFLPKSHGSGKLRITVWSLCTKSVSYIKYPKACQQGITFTRDGRYMALAERRDCKDHVSVFVCSDWQLLRHFDTETQDLAGIEWAPNGCVLAVWDTCLEVVYKEAEKNPRLALGRLAFPPPRAAAGPASTTESKYEIASAPVSLQTLKPIADRANPKIGIGALAFSPDNYFLATRNDSVPNAVWIWDVQKLRLFVVLEQLSPVRSFQWDPQQPRLAICTGGGKVYLWSPAGCVSVQVPGEGDFQVLSLCWHFSGDSLALLSKDHFCLCFLETEERVGTAFGRPGDHT
ncbi:WD repeat-containing protein WRAP73 isoform X4 [Ailuropoda melanoleuca]|uniref:WD repeat-containing protein WRAP73 isoform X4 n=1 Tax=Ailuropoda melanoleuca TaxID=9646 RepID=UPI0014947502|nr:WD repeat-containing protein WRAP73 isoform X4 [Ailuropoda melanoleuca]